MLMDEARRKGVWPEKKGKKMENAPLSLYDVGEEGGEEEDPEALSDDDVGEQHITNKGEGKEERRASESVAHGARRGARRTDPGVARRVPGDRRIPGSGGEGEREGKGEGKVTNERVAR